jgi:hypothetical protein
MSIVTLPESDHEVDMVVEHSLVDVSPVQTAPQTNTGDVSLHRGLGDSRTHQHDNIASARLRCTTQAALSRSALDQLHLLLRMHNTAQLLSGKKEGCTLRG